MFRWLMLLILIVPALEIGIFIWAGDWLGVFPVIFLILLTGVVGAWLAKQQGLETIRNVQYSMSTGQMPQDALLDGACILVGGTLLLTPGFITDTIGFLLLFPSTRILIKRVLRKAITKMMANGSVTIYRR